MRVCLATAFPADPGLPRGGVEAVSVTLVRALAAHPSVEVHVVTADRRGGLPRREEWSGAVVHRLPWRGRWMLTGALWPMHRALSAFVRDLSPDVVHAHDTYGLMLRGLDLPRVLTIHGFIHGDTLVASDRWARTRATLWKYVEERTWADYPAIVSISPYVRQRLDGVTRAAIHDIDNPIDAGFFDLRRRNGPRVIFCAAVISRRKNTLGLLEAFARVRSSGIAATLRVAGAVAEPAYARLVDQRIAALGLERDVSLLGPLRTSAIREELQRATVFALVSREENSPLGIEEAMAAGVPVVASNRCGMPYMVRHGVSGFLVDPEDDADIAARLRAVLEDPALGGEMGRRGREIALERFHPHVVAARTLAVYQGLLRPSGRPAAVS